MAKELALEGEEWYVLCSWLRARENRLMYAVRPRSEEWAAVRDLRRTVEARREDAAETSGALRTVTLSDAQFDRLRRFLRRRSIVLRLVPWRDRERRDVVRLRRRIAAEA